MEKNEYVYIVLIKALTGLGKFSRKLNHYEYTHIAVCFEDTLSDFVTFSRKGIIRLSMPGLCTKRESIMLLGITIE